MIEKTYLKCLRKDGVTFKVWNVAIYKDSIKIEYGIEGDTLRTKTIPSSKCKMNPYLEAQTRISDKLNKGYTIAREEKADKKNHSSDFHDYIEANKSKKEPPKEGLKWPEKEIVWF